MNPSNEKNNLIEKLKKHSKRFKEKRSQSFENLGKTTGEFFSNLKGGFNTAAEKVVIYFKKLQLKRLMEETKRWRQHPKTIALRQILEKDLRKLKDKTSDIKEDTEQIKQDTSEILLNSNQILTILDNINYKSDKLEELILPLTPVLEGILAKQENIEEFLEDKLGSKWKKLKKDWQKLKNNEISRSDFLVQGFKVLGKQFISVFRSQLV